MADGPSYGVNLVTQHNRWDNVLGQFTGKATFEVCAFGVCRMKIIPFSAADIAEWAVRIASWIDERARDLAVPRGNGYSGPTDDYAPAYTGAMPLVPNLANQDDVGAEVPAYTYELTEGEPP